MAAVLARLSHSLPRASNSRGLPETEDRAQQGQRCGRQRKVGRRRLDSGAHLGAHRSARCSGRRLCGCVCSGEGEYPVARGLTVGHEPVGVDMHAAAAQSVDTGWREHVAPRHALHEPISPPAAGTGASATSRPPARPAPRTRRQRSRSRCSPREPACGTRSASAAHR